MSNGETAPEALPDTKLEKGLLALIKEFGFMAVQGALLTPSLRAGFDPNRRPAPVQPVDPELDGPVIEHRPTRNLGFLPGPRTQRDLAAQTHIRSHIRHIDE